MLERLITTFASCMQTKLSLRPMPASDAIAHPRIVYTVFHHSHARHTFSRALILQLDLHPFLHRGSMRLRIHRLIAQLRPRRRRRRRLFRKAEAICERLGNFRYRGRGWML